jgi:gliding motility-associated-like protein
VSVTGGTGPYSYEWNTSPLQTSATAAGLSAGNYIVSVTDSHGCNTTGNVVILQPSDEISITLTQVSPQCAGGGNGSATAQVIGGTGPYTYSWDTSPEQTTATATGLSTGSYTVTITDFNGCTKSGSVAITEPEPIVLDHSATVASCPDAADGSITLTVTGGTAPYNFIWSDGAITQNRTNIKPGTYSVVVTDMNSCAKALEAEVDFTGTFECVVIPQIITPNNDGYNDTWILKNIDLYPDAEMLVFNRWGKLIFRTKNISDNPWDGRYNGKLVPTDSYHYILYLNDGSEPKSGVISVIR